MWENTYYFFKVGVKIYTFIMTYRFWRNYVCDSSYFYSFYKEIAILNIPVVK